jgi:3',5'-cyclic AMP phosphodiesterase CpdA
VRWSRTAKRSTDGDTGGTAALATLVLLLCTGCTTTASMPAPVATVADFPPVRFAVISDPHLFDTDDSSPGPAFDRALASGLKLHAESREILERALSDIAAERPAFLLVCGDLTRNGERSAHEMAAAMLGAFDAAGVPVLVVPGNHDVANPGAARFAGDAAETVPSVTPVEFAAIYAELGYADALERDPASLSYVAEPAPGLRVLALDGCRYDGPPGSPRTDGRLSRQTRAWAGRALERARADGAATIVMLHHAVVPHFEDMEAWLDRYLLDGHDAVAHLFAAGGARLVFTGHGHAQDVVRGGTAAGPVWDVETGSLASWPCPWRMVALGPGASVRIESHRVTSTTSLGDGFAAYARQRLDDGLRDAALDVLRRMSVRGVAALAIARQAAAAGAAYYAGDEPGPVGRIDRSTLGPWSGLAAAAVRGLLDTLGTDLEPGDNEVSFTAR